jgi:hypothetical protein
MLQRRKYGQFCNVLLFANVIIVMVIIMLYDFFMLFVVKYVVVIQIPTFLGQCLKPGHPSPPREH